MDRIVLAHSGGFVTTVAIPWLAEKYHAEIVAVIVDLGHTRKLDAVHTRALAMGAARAHVIDAGDEFARDFVLPALQAGALDDGLPMSVALARPVIAQHLVEIARIEGASWIAHGCALETGDAARLERLVRALNPSMKFIPLARRLPRPGAIAYARQHGLTVPSADAPRAIDANLWGRAMDLPATSAAARHAAGEAASLTKLSTDTPDDAAVVEIDFDHGIPVSINGVEMPLVELVQSLDTIAGAHGIGRIDRLDAPTARVCEAPAAVVLHEAHAALQASVTSGPVQEITARMAATYADLIEDGWWFTPARAAVDAVVGKLQEVATGVVRLRLQKGECRVVGGPSPNVPHDECAAARRQDA
jgi:argininosuccinate synthase